jgi:hypothetical protein
MTSLLFLTGLTLASCASAPDVAQGVSKGAYRLPRGTADYDSLQRERSRCAGQGGEVVARSGADLTKLADYNCVIGGGH